MSSDVVFCCKSVVAVEGSSYATAELSTLSWNQQNVDCECLSVHAVSDMGAMVVVVVSSYIMMAEPDHVFIKPLPNLASELMPAAFPFFYIEPKKNEAVLRKFYPEEKGPITNIDPIGNSPVIIQKV